MTQLQRIESIHARYLNGGRCIAQDSLLFTFHARLVTDGQLAISALPMKMSFTSISVWRESTDLALSQCVHTGREVSFELWQ